VFNSRDNERWATRTEGACELDASAEVAIERNGSLARIGLFASYKTSTNSLGQPYRISAYLENKHVVLSAGYFGELGRALVDSSPGRTGRTQGRLRLVVRVEERDGRTVSTASVYFGQASAPTIRRELSSELLVRLGGQTGVYSYGVNGTVDEYAAVYGPCN
jgi:hypothetical protein